MLFKTIMSLKVKKKISAAKIALSSEKLNRYPTIDLNIQMARGSSESTFFVDSETNQIQ